MARARAMRGDLEGAVAAWEEARALTHELGAIVLEVFACSALAVALVQLQRIDEAQARVDRCRRLLDNGEDWSGTRGHVVRATASVAAARGEFAEADAQFAEALEIAREFEDRWGEAEIHHLWGRSLLERGSRRAAGEQLDAALAHYRAMGAGTPWLERVLADKLRAQGSSSTQELTRTIDVVAATIDARRPDMATHAAPDGTVTLMFSDMEGFTEMTRRLGDLAAREVIRRHNAIVREACSRHGGYEVELQGDGFLLAFGSARAGLQCAMTIQRELEADAERHPEQPIRVRIGLHTGEALRDADKFFGRTVILAARIAAQAQGGEILASALLKELTESVGDLRFGPSREVALKGFPDPHRVFPVAWS
jgi:class 3 adenylate cyclase